MNFSAPPDTLARTRADWLAGSRDAWARYAVCATQQVQAATSVAARSRTLRPPARHLGQAETLRVDTGCLVAFAESVDYDIEFQGGFKNALFGGEGLFLATVRGPGTVYLQSLPFSRLADRIVAASRTYSNRGETSGGRGALGALGGLAAGGLLGGILGEDN